MQEIKVGEKTILRLPLDDLLEIFQSYCNEFKNKKGETESESKKDVIVYIDLDLDEFCKGLKEALIKKEIIVPGIKTLRFNK